LLGVAALPRNYELIYEALSGHIPQLAADLAAIGPAPTQERLDELGIRHNLISHSRIAADRARAEAQDMLATLAAELRLALAQRHGFNEQLTRFSSRLSSDPVVAFSEFAEEAARLRDAAGQLSNEEGAVSTAIDLATQRLGKLEGDLKESRKPLTLDRMTGLPNQAALSKKLAEVFEAPRPDRSLALVIASVDGLKDLEEHHGRAVAEKALRRLSAVLRRSIKKGDFVARFSPQVFAFLCNDVNAENAEAIARRIQKVIANLPIVPAGRVTSERLCFSAGIALSERATCPLDLLRQAEFALAAARTEKGGGIRAYAEDPTVKRGERDSPRAA
ncbi:MAG TPA: GGDEF domain-containing protein, partial [Sinorhizobium sp.]|nr:GGDEF domain-containing protein [Sinorhizobium sp.]